MVTGSQAAREKLASYYLSNQKIPETLEDAGVSGIPADGSALSLDPKRMSLTVKTKHGELVFVPAKDAQGGISWTCANGEGLKPAQLPPSCRPRSGR